MCVCVCVCVCVRERFKQRRRNRWTEWQVEGGKTHKLYQSLHNEQSSSRKYLADTTHHTSQDAPLSGATQWGILYYGDIRDTFILSQLLLKGQFELDLTQLSRV